MKPFDYTSPTRIKDVLALLDQDGDRSVKLLAGGTDLLTLIKADIATPDQLIDIKRLNDLPRGIEETDGGVTLGALTTLTEIETSPLIQQRYPMLAEAAAVAATPQLRNMATLGGNLLQRPRCWYFRSPHFHCWLKGGDECQARDGENQLHALFGDSPCVAVHPSDLAPTLVALDAELRVRGRHGDRALSIADFFALPVEERRTETALGNDELLLSIQLPSLPNETRSTYLKAMDRNVWAFALVGVAAMLRMGGSDGLRIEDARLVLSGVAPVPWRAKAAEQELIGSEVSPKLIAQAAETALANVVPLQHNAYKVSLAKALVRRALTTLSTNG